MAVSNLDIAEFYEQLALLVKAKLPLPESLEQLGKNFRKKQFREVLEQVSAEVGKGRPLHEAMDMHPDCFPEFHRQLIKTGEESGTLQEILFEVARFAKQNQDMVARTKETMSYPAFTIFLSLLVFAMILRFVVPAFEEMLMATFGFADYSGSELTRVPFYTRLVFAMSHFTGALGMSLYVLFGVAAIAGLLLFSGLKKADDLCYRLMVHVPGVGRMIREADWARVAGLLGVYLKRKTPMVDALQQTAALVKNDRLAVRLEYWATHVSAGGDLGELMTQEGYGAEPLLALCIRHSPEESLGDELYELSQLYSARAEAARGRAIAIWQFITVVAMTGTVGWVVISMFSPLFSILKRLI